MGGYFCVNGINNLARWNGTDWSSLGSGVSSDVWALTIYDGALVVGGSFARVGAITANYIAMWRD
jgi:hypothetical protein